MTEEYEPDHEMCLGSDRQTIQSSNGMDDLCVVCGESVATNAEGVAYDHLRAPQFKVIPGSRVRFDYLQGGA